MTDDFSALDATQQAALVRNGEVKAVELVEAAIGRDEKLDPELNAVIHRQYDHALDRASGNLPDGPFTGVPFLLKDFACHEAGQPFHEGLALPLLGQFGSTPDNPLAGLFRAAALVPFTPPINVTGQPAISLRIVAFHGFDQFADGAPTERGRRPALRAGLAKGEAAAAEIAGQASGGVGS